MSAPRRWWWVLLIAAAACAARQVRAPGDPARAPTVDVGVELSDVLETARLVGACEAYAEGARDRATVLQCGKWMYFYETFGTAGIPSRLLRFSQKHYAEFYGRGFERLGLIADPASEEGMPLGLAPGRSSTHAFTCAACHFAKLPDGRYAVGAANERFDYGMFVASLGAPLGMSFKDEDPATAPALRAALRDHVAKAKGRSGYSAQAGMLGLSLIATPGSRLTVADQERFLALVPGTMDFLTAPLLDDGVWTISRIVSLWDLPDEQARKAAGMPNELLSWNGGARSLMDFLHGFAAIGAGDAWPDERLIPLRDYVYTLRAPAVPAAEGAEAGLRLFSERGCAKCHDGPSGSSTRVFTFAEIQTDDVYGNIYAPGPDGRACCGLSVEAEAITRGVKAPRMTGMFATTRLLHNGSVNGLDELFCLKPRAVDAGHGQGAGGHWMTCEGLSDDEKRALISYLSSR